MPPRKKTIENFVQDIMELDCPLDSPEAQQIINKAAYQFKSKGTNECKTNRMVAREEELAKEKSILELKGTSSNKERAEFKKEIDQLEKEVKELQITQLIWDQTIITRKHVYYFTANTSLWRYILCFRNKFGFDI